MLRSLTAAALVIAGFGGPGRAPLMRWNLCRGPLFLLIRNRSKKMSRGFPSMTALLGLLAIAGYQNRDKIAEMLGGIGQRTPGAAGQGGIGGLLGQLSSSLGGASAGGILSGGLGELVDRFKQSGQSETAESWVKTGPNKQCTPAQLEQAIGPEVLDTLSKQTGLAREELLSRLCRALPDAVDKYTPQGRLPTEAELSRA
jgi:uncharacterized protein YidB (DUF937 family)